MLKIHKVGEPVLTIHRQTFRTDTLVYIGVANKELSYKFSKKSPIVYIGTTKNGVQRIAQSAAYHASNILGEYGIHTLNFYHVTCKPKKGLKTWKKLERALIITFREIFGEVPYCNKQGKNMDWHNERTIFNVNSLRDIIQKYSNKNRGNVKCKLKSV